jgi:nucleoside-diphosphate-sugar epimerase
VQPGPLLLPEGGLNAWGFLWVDDIADVAASSLGNRTAHGRAYNLAQREALSLRQLVEMAAECLGREARVLSIPTAWLEAIDLGTSYSPYTHDRDVLLDCRRAVEELLFEPTPPERWVPALVDDFRARWDGVPRACANTRAFELSLAAELGTVRLPTYVATDEASGPG